MMPTSVFSPKIWQKAQIDGRAQTENVLYMTSLLCTETLGTEQNSQLPNKMIFVICIWVSVMIIFQHPSNREIYYSNVLRAEQQL